MRRLEIIHLRFAADPPPRLVEDIRRSILAAGESSSVRIYHHSTITTDLGVHLDLHVDEVDTQPSDLGVHLAAALRDHGMVEHTVWIEDNPDEMKGASR